MAAPAIFVHDPGEYRLTDPGTVVALTASAFEACKRAGLSPTVLDDHTKRPEFCRNPDAYQRWQLDWLNRLDAACQLNGVAPSCAHLMVPPVDSLVMTARMLAGAVDTLAPESITYVGKVGPVEATGFHNGHLQFWPSLGDAPLAGRLLPMIARARSLTYDARPVDGPAPAGRPPQHLLARARREVSRTLGPSRRVYRRHIKRRTHRSTTLMLWYAGYGADQFAADERSAGRDTAFITRGGASFRIVDPGLPPSHAPGRRIDLNVRPVTALDPALTSLLEEVDDWAGVPGASRILQSRLAVFVHGICVTVADAARRAQRDLAAFAIERVAAANPSSLEEFACLNAARAAGIPRMLVQHGDHLLAYGFWLVMETVNFEELAASDPTMGDELTAAATRLGVVAPRVTYFAPRIRALLEGARSHRRLAQGEGPICYLPAFFLGDSRYVSGCNFDDAWYHRWHLRILDLMGTRPDLRFIWKGLPSSDQAVDPIPSIIAERGLRHVAYETRPFTKVVSEVDRIFTDFPSTALYESVHLGKPVLAVTFPRFFSVRPTAAARFAQVLRECDTEEQALAQISGFLDGDPNLWVLPEENLAIP
jgi:hypothetical protein